MDEYRLFRQMQLLYKAFPFLRAFNEIVAKAVDETYIYTDCFNIWYGSPPSWGGGNQLLIILFSFDENTQVSQPHVLESCSRGGFVG